VHISPGLGILGDSLFDLQTNLLPNGNRFVSGVYDSNNNVTKMMDKDASRLG
jgi:hypothetical protein